MTGRYSRYLEYKDSGVDWLGEVPAHWEVKKLKYQASIQPSNVDKKTKEGDQSVRLCNYTDVYYNDMIDESLEYMVASASDEQVEKFTLKAGDTIITKDSEDPTDIAVPAYVPKDLPGVVCGYHLAMIRPFDQNYGSFIKRVFEGGYARAYFCTRSNGLTRYGLGVYPLSNVYYPRPAKKEAVQIANFLDHETAKIDTLIEKQQQLIKLLKEKRQAVISHAVTKGLNPNAPMKDSGIEWLGEVPEGWSKKAIKHLFSFVVDNRGRTPTLQGSGIPIVEVRQVAGDGFYTSTDYQKFIGQQAYEDFIRADVLENDILFVTVGATVGKCCLVPKNPNFVIAQNLVAFRSSEDCAPFYIMYLLSSDIAVDAILTTNKANTIDNVKLSDFVQYKVFVPPFEEQKKIANHITEIAKKVDRTIEKCEEQKKILQERRTALISAAVTGKIDVRNWQAGG